MTDRLHSCKDSPDGRHRPSEHSGWFCRYCFRTIDYLRDMGWNAPKHDPDAWKDEEADINDAPQRASAEECECTNSSSGWLCERPLGHKGLHMAWEDYPTRHYSGSPWA